MIFNTFITSQQDLQRCHFASNLEEVLIEPKLLARQGILADSATFDLATNARRMGLRTVLVWDALMSEQLTDTVLNQLSQWDLCCFDAIRVIDPGIALWINKNLTCMPIQLLAEAGSHNLHALQGWCEVFKNLERLILSIELPEPKLTEYCRQLPVQCELLGLGPILLFYSPRHLLSPHIDRVHGVETCLETTVAHFDTPNKVFPAQETQHGTLMFLHKDQFILDRYAGLDKAGLWALRLDVRHLSTKGHSAENIDVICARALNDPLSLKASWPKPTHAPFFKTNKTSASFAQMQSNLVDYHNHSCLAEVIASENGKYIVFHATRDFTPDQARYIVVPAGDTVVLDERITFSSVTGKPLLFIKCEQVFISGWIKKAVSGSLLLEHDPTA